MRLDRRTVRALSLISGLGFSIAVCVGGSVLVGFWLDERFHTRPVMVLVGIFVGLFGAASIIYHLAVPDRPTKSVNDDDASES